ARRSMAHNEPHARAGPPRAQRTGRALFAILLVGALLRGLYLREIASSPELAAPALDAAFHDHWARALVSGDWSPPRFFADPQIQTTPYFRPPGYPFFLALVYAITGGSPLGARAVQMLLGLANVWLAFALGRALFDRAVGLLAAAGMACTWTLLYFEGELLAPVLLVTLGLASALVWHRWWHRGSLLLGTAGGLLLGLSALARPNALALVPVVWLWALWVARRRPGQGRMRSVLLGLPLGVFAAIAPATIRNAVTAHDFVVLTSNGGVNLYIGNNEQADGHTARIPILGDLAPVQGWTCFDQPAIVRGVERLEGRPLAASEVSRFFARRALDFAAAHPGAVLALALKKTALFWGPVEVANNRELEVARQHSAVLRWLPTFPWVLSLAVIGTLMLWRDLRRAPRDHRSDLVVLLAAIVLVDFASHLPFFVAGRYRMPILPLLLLGAAYAVRTAFTLQRERRWRGLARWCAAWLVLLALAHVRLVDYEPDPGQWHFQRGDAFRMLGDLDRAIDEFRLAIASARTPDAVPHNNLGAALMQRGRLPEAILSLREAVRLDPAYVQAHFNLALALANAGQDELACAEFEQVLRRDPSSTPARIQLGAILVRLGRAAEALPHLEAAAHDAPRDTAVRYLHAIALLDVGRQRDARAILEGFERTEPRFADARVALAELAEQAGDRAGALRLVEQALAVEPGHAGAKALRERLQ
ncbi:MAG TPA: tetratricopeptide repeat protein, partial [Planctomycetota bacterium]|nr:tetratricopeptide repeat protein [Planctomycetota bacterium]